MVHVPIMFLSEWHEFLLVPCLAGKKTLWHLASQCCWNCTSHLTCFLSASVTREDLQFGTWTAPSFQRHYRFRPTTSEVGQAKDLSALPSYFKPLHWIGADCPLHAWAGLHPMHISPLTYWTRGWVGGRTSPVALERKQSLFPHTPEMEWFLCCMASRLDAILITGSQLSMICNCSCNNSLP